MTNIRYVWEMNLLVNWLGLIYILNRCFILVVFSIYAFYKINFWPILKKLSQKKSIFLIFYFFEVFARLRFWEIYTGAARFYMQRFFLDPQSPKKVLRAEKGLQDRVRWNHDKQCRRWFTWQGPNKKCSLPLKSYITELKCYSDTFPANNPSLS